MGFLDFLSSDFKKAIPAMAKDNGWTVAEVGDERAVLQFATASGRTQTLYVIKYPNTLEFSVPSEAVYNSLDEIPDGLPSRLLKRNGALQTGFWALEEIDGKWVFSTMYCETLGNLHAEMFGRIVDGLVDECDRFDKSTNG